MNTFPFCFPGKYLGQRFIKDNDIGLVLIYDVQGTIAGVQMGVSVDRAVSPFSERVNDHIYSIQ